MDSLIRFFKFMLFALGVVLLVSCGSKYKGPKSDHFDGIRFFNPTGADDKSLWQVIRWQWGRIQTEWPLWVENTATPRLPERVGDGEVVITFVNHATVLVQLAGLNVLTDPVWSDRTSPFTWLGPKRVRPPGLPWENLPKIDVVLVSHNHYDHLDLPTLKRLSDRFAPKIFVPLGDGPLLESADIQNVTELDWWQEVAFSANSKIIFTPTQHWSARGLFDRRKSLWGSYVIAHGSRRVYFGGDAGYSSHYKSIFDRLGPMDFSMLPIGAYEPRWFMKDHHMNPEEAVQAHLDLKSKVSMGVHFGTWQLTDEGIDEPVQALSEARRKLNVPDDHFLTLKEGETRAFKYSN